MNKFYQLLQNIKDDPVAYLEKPSITCLYSFLNGYLIAQSGISKNSEDTYLEGFQEWIQAKEKTQMCASWARIILFTSNEKSAFSRFFELFEQFLKEKNSREVPSGNEDNSHPTCQPSNLRHLTLYELIDGIKRRPGMYLGTNSITRLEMYLRGYNLARREVGIPPDEQEREFAGFQSWIQNKYEIKSGQSWGKIILFYSIDEPEALTKFFELFEQYLNRERTDGDKFPVLVQQEAI